LYNGDGGAGWYGDIQSSITVKGLTNNYTLIRGSMRGTYLLIFNETSSAVNK